MRVRFDVRGYTSIHLQLELSYLQLELSYHCLFTTKDRNALNPWMILSRIYAADNKSFKLNGLTVVDKPPLTHHFIAVNLNTYAPSAVRDIRYVECVASLRWDLDGNFSNASFEPQFPVIPEL